MSHTPGPWHVRPPITDDVNGGEYRPINANPGWIADVRCSSNEEEANARLIAAAPELLEACLAALGAYEALQIAGVAEHLPGFDSCLEVTRAAIAKVKGTPAP